MVHAALLQALIATLPFARAADPTPDAPAPAPDLGAEIHDEYIRGYPVVIPITVRNPGTAPLAFPDLQSRPWLVRFDLKAQGRVQTRNTTPPADDARVKWQIAGGGRRRVLLEIPSGAALTPQTYTLTVRVVDGDHTWTVASQDIRIAPPHPLAEDIVDEGIAFTSTGSMVPWIQKTATAAVDLYLLHGSSSDPTAPAENTWLTRLPAAVEPSITGSRPQDAWIRAMTWTDADHALWVAHLEPQGLHATPRRVGLPWPSWHTLGRGVTDPEGRVHVPVWVDAPQGTAGEVRIVEVDERGNATFRPVLHLPRPPEAVATAADTGGQLRLGLLYDQRIDLYTDRPGQPIQVPAQGKRIWRPPTDPATPAASPYTGLSLETLPEAEGWQGGLALFAWSAFESAERKAIWGTWFSLEGRRLLDVDGVEIPRESTVRNVLSGSGGPLVAVVDTKGTTQAWSARWTEPVTVPDLGSRDALRLVPDGRLYVTRVRDGAGFVTARLPTP